MKNFAGWFFFSFSFSLIGFRLFALRGGVGKGRKRKKRGKKGLTGTEHVRVWSSTCIAFLYRGAHET